MISVVRCGRHGCSRRTRHHSGRCHDHRSASLPSETRPALPFPEGPQVAREHHDDGSLSGERHLLDRRLHRLDGPAECTFYPSGGLSSVIYAERGRYHRVGAPAASYYFRNGAISTEIYYHRGRRHRVDGPALVSYADDGEVLAEQFEWRGESYGSHEALLRDLVLTPDPKKLATELRTSSYGALLREGHSADEIAAGFVYGIRTAEGLRAHFSGAPIEWVRAYETGGIS